MNGAELRKQMIERSRPRPNEAGGRKIEDQLMTVIRWSLPQVSMSRYHGRKKRR